METAEEIEAAKLHIDRLVNLQQAYHGSTWQHDVS